MISARRPLPVGAADFKLLMAKRALKPFELTDSDLRQAVHAAPPGSLVFVLDHPELTGRCASAPARIVTRRAGAAQRGVCLGAPVLPVISARSARLTRPCHA